MISDLFVNIKPAKVQDKRVKGQLSDHKHSNGNILCLWQYSYVTFDFDVQFFHSIFRKNPGATAIAPSCPRSIEIGPVIKLLRFPQVKVNTNALFLQTNVLTQLQVGAIGMCHLYWKCVTFIGNVSLLLEMCHIYQKCVTFIGNVSLLECGHAYIPPIQLYNVFIQQLQLCT